VGPSVRSEPWRGHSTPPHALTRRSRHGDPLTFHCPQTRLADQGARPLPLVSVHRVGGAGPGAQASLSAQEAEALGWQLFGALDGAVLRMFPASASAPVSAARTGCWTPEGCSTPEAAMFQAAVEGRGGR